MEPLVSQCGFIPMYLERKNVKILLNLISIGHFTFLNFAHAYHIFECCYG